MKIEVPQQGLKFRWNGFFNQAATKPAPLNALSDKNSGQLLGLKESTLMGSALVDITSGAGVTVGIGDRTGSTSLQFRSTDELPGIFSVQAPPLSRARARFYATVFIELARRVRARAPRATFLQLRTSASSLRGLCTFLIRRPLHWRARR